MKWKLLALAGIFSSCAVDSKGILLDVEAATPIDQGDLQKHCDLGDQAACALSHARPNAAPAPTFSIVQGIAPADRAVFAALVPRGTPLIWFFYDRGQSQLWKLNTARIQTRPGSPWAIQRVEIRGLEPAHDYELLAADQNGHLLEDRNFRTLYAEDDHLRVVMVSGLRYGSRAGNDRLINAAKANAPSLMIFAGGNVDATLPRQLETPNPHAALDRFFARFSQARKAGSFGYEPSLIPAVAVWNESEYGSPSGDRRFPYRDQAREVFKIFFPQWADEVTVVSGPGVAKSIQLGGRLLAFLDNRSFRTPSPHPPAALPAMSSFYGNMQADWLSRQAEKAGLPVYLFSGEPWFSALQENWNDLSSLPLSPLETIAPGGLAVLEAQKRGPLTLTGIVPESAL